MEHERVSLWRHFRAIMVLPGVFAMSLPLLFAVVGDEFGPAWLGMHVGWGLPSLLIWLPMFAGALLIFFSMILFTLCVAEFHRAGGTLAPFDPPKRLVTTGPYAHSRNAMFIGVFGFILGLTTLLGSLAMLAYLIVFASVIIFLETKGEEKKLRELSGYANYSVVPAWGWQRKPYSDQ